MTNCKIKPVYDAHHWVPQIVAGFHWDVDVDLFKKDSKMVKSDNRRLQNKCIISLKYITLKLETFIKIPGLMVASISEGIVMGISTKSWTLL
jgi:hypothetical protein